MADRNPGRTDRTPTKSYVRSRAARLAIRGPWLLAVGVERWCVYHAGRGACADMSTEPRMANRTHRTSAPAVAWVSLVFVVVAQSGCIVGQPPGKGRTIRIREATTGAPYWLYLPADYDEPPPPGEKPRKRALVMTFHGMKPFDDDNRQIREWQQEADRYGLVVCAPALRVADIFGPLPLKRRDHPSLRRDERAIIAIMDELYRTVNVDPNMVLSTSWSYGGYIAHYMANRYPERFSCIAVRQSNFNADLLDPAAVPRYRDHKVAVFYTENDFAICKRESQDAARWYAHHGFDLTYAVFEKKGHERTPSVAAEFFARTCGLEANSPPTELAHLQVKTQTLPPPTRSAVRSTPPVKTGRMDAISGKAPPPVEPVPTEIAIARSPFNSPNASSQSAANAAPPGRVPSTNRTGPAWNASLPSRGAALTTRPVAPSTRRGPTPDRLTPNRSQPADGPIRIRVSSTIGVAPLLVSYSALLPKSLRKEAHLLWTDNGEPISNGINGQKVLTEPGEHSLEVLVTAADGKEYRNARVITVIERMRGRK